VASATMGGGTDVRLARSLSPAEQGLRVPARIERGDGVLGDDAIDGPAASAAAVQTACPASTLLTFRTPSKNARDRQVIWRAVLDRGGRDDSTRVSSGFSRWAEFSPTGKCCNSV